MPQWGMGMQGWVNGWVKVNNKHVVFPNGRRQTAEERARDGLGPPVVGATREQRPLPRKKGPDRGGSPTASTGPTWEDPEIRAIRRYNSRKKGRRLQRTKSHSDLVREMARSKEKESDELHSQPGHQAEPEANAVLSQASEQSSTHFSKNTVSLTFQEVNRQPDATDFRSITTVGETTAHSNNSLRWGTGVFDVPFETGKPFPIPPHPQHPVTTGKYLNETAFVQQYQQSKQTEAQTSQRRMLSSGNASGEPNSKYRGPTVDAALVHHQGLKDGPLQSKKKWAESKSGSDPSTLSSPSLGRRNSSLSKDDSHASSESEILELRRPPLGGSRTAGPMLNGVEDLHRTKQRSVPFSGRSIRNNTPAASSPCSLCEELTGQLHAAQADLEYLRSVSLRGEYLCASCENTSSSRRKNYVRGSSLGGSGSIALNEASQRLVEVTGRHKRQIEQMTRERSRWQHDIHFKLSKFAMMCNHWSKESASRNEEATSLESELFTAQTERNSKTSEVQTLCAQLSLHGKQDTEHKELQQSLEQYEEEGLQVAEQEIRKRDAVISDLSLRLDRTVETLEMERQQQRQRRQIIFPVARTSQQHLGAGRDVATVDPEIMKLNKELEKAKNDSRIANEKLDAAKAVAEKRERQLQLRCEQLEKLVKESEKGEDNE